MWRIEFNSFSLSCTRHEIFGSKLASMLVRSLLQALNSNKLLVTGVKKLKEEGRGEENG